MQELVFSLDYAKQRDAHDLLNNFQNKFYFPYIHERKALYFSGASLGLQPHNTQDEILTELEDWANYGAEGYFHSRNTWFTYHDLLVNETSNIIGAIPSEVVIMNQLTVNLHLLLVSFYRPSKQRYKIICEAQAFSSDQYALESQVRFYGLDPKETIIEVQPPPGEYCIAHQDIYAAIEKHKDELALVLWGGVNFFTGQAFDIKTITDKAHRAGAFAGFDLAHAVGNIELQLHDWRVDFAVWCSNKYLNAGPGSVGGAFVHQKYDHENLIRFAGWWGHNKETRFQMPKNFDPIEGAEGWQISNMPILSMAAYKASLSIFEEAGMENIIKKSKDLKKFAEFVFDEVNKQIDVSNKLEIITPLSSNPKDFFGSGNQISFKTKANGKKLYEDLLKHGVISDWREPEVIRIALVPLYNSFEDVFELGSILIKLLK